MASIVDFDAAALTHLLSDLGIRKAWLSMLRTSLQDRPDLQYIFDSREFRGAQILEADLLAGLTIGEISVLYEYSHAIEDADARKSNGLYFTPDDVASFMAGFSERFPVGKWLDPCSGIGNLSWYLVAVQDDPEEFLRTRMILSDRDELALLIARTLLTSAFQRTRTGLFHEIQSNFAVFDFLSVADGDGGILFPDGDGLGEIPEHDFVIVNPPYLATKRKDPRFETGRSADLYAYFLENIVKTSGGFIAVTPQSFTNARKFEPLRALLLDRYRNLTVLCFDNIPGNVFSGIKFGSRNSNTANSTRAAITVALPGDGSRRITSLMRWRSAERQQMFANVERFASPMELGIDYFPKVSPVFRELYDMLLDAPRLSSLCHKSPTEYPLFVPAAPRYFISALKAGVQRVSQRVLYFRSAEDRDRAYLLLNSSLMYWWWRVRDGGMTLSQETLLTGPIPDFCIDPVLVSLLEGSEAINRVFKLNAGVAQENVKHPLELTSRLNELVAPHYADRLILTHENTELVQIPFLDSVHEAEPSDCSVTRSLDTVTATPEL
jgi:hypothetical protein